MKKYIQSDQRRPTPSSKSSSEDSNTNPYAYPYYNPENSNALQRSNIVRSQRPGQQEESLYSETPNTTRPRNNTQRTLNEKCRVEKIPSSRQNPSSYPSENQMQKQMKDYILKLKDIKTNMQNEISELQQILDQTSRYLQGIDIQFEKIKIRIMDYTSRYLDHAFKTYKKQMPRWSKYEQVQKKSLQLVQELDDYIRQQQNLHEHLTQTGFSFDIVANNEELANRTSHYTFMGKEIKRIKEECLGKHPTIREDKVKQFEQSLAQLCAF